MRRAYFPLINGKAFFIPSERARRAETNFPAMVMIPAALPSHKNSDIAENQETTEYKHLTKDDFTSSPWLFPPLSASNTHNRSVCWIWQEQFIKKGKARVHRALNTKLEFQHRNTKVSVQSTFIPSGKVWTINLKIQESLFGNYNLSHTFLIAHANSLWHTTAFYKK